MVSFITCVLAHRGLICLSVMGPEPPSSTVSTAGARQASGDTLMDAIIVAHEARGNDVQMIDSTTVRVHQQAVTSPERFSNPSDYYGRRK